MNLDDLLKKDLVKPQFADYIDLTYQGINFHVYGILHGITGGTNLEYKKFINATIQHSKGLKLGEKSMLKMYKGLDAELEDWVQVTNKDAFYLTLKLFTNPLAMGSILKTVFKEYTQKNDRFNLNTRRLQDIGGSPYFHLIDPFLRRRYMGFPSSEDYFIENSNRRKNKSNISSIVFPDPDWRWLTYIEPYANIPFRSVHMIEHAVLQARKKNLTEVSIFIGETHNTDIAWYVNHAKLSDNLETEIEKIKIDALNLENNKFLKKLGYLGAVALSASIPIFSILLTLILTKCI